MKHATKLLNSVWLLPTLPVSYCSAAINTIY